MEEGKGKGGGDRMDHEEVTMRVMLRDTHELASAYPRTLTHSCRVAG